MRFLRFAPSTVPSNTNPLYFEKKTKEKETDHIYYYILYMSLADWPTVALLSPACNIGYSSIQNLSSNIIHSRGQNLFYIKYFLFINQSPLIISTIASNYEIKLG